MIGWADVVNIAPELAAIPSGTQTAILADVYAQLNVTCWGGALDRGAKYLAAHLATIYGRPIAAAYGPVGAPYSPTAANADLRSTSYGQEYERLLMALPMARFSIGC